MLQHCRSFHFDQSSLSVLDGTGHRRRRHVRPAVHLVRNRLVDLVARSGRVRPEHVRQLLVDGGRRRRRPVVRQQLLLDVAEVVRLQLHVRLCVVLLRCRVLVDVLDVVLMLDHLLGDNHLTGTGFVGLMGGREIGGGWVCVRNGRCTAVLGNTVILQ